MADAELEHEYNDCKWMGAVKFSGITVTLGGFPFKVACGNVLFGAIAFYVC